MTKKISETQPVIEFINIAREFCLLIEKRDEKTAIRLLQEVFILLPQLCQRGMKLPDIKRLSKYKPARITHEQWNELYKSLQQKINNYDPYTKVFDPYDEKNRTAIPHSLSDDLAGIYRDIESGLQDWSKVTAQERLNIIWEWKFGFESHWGRHATGAFKALYSLLYEHIEGEHELYIGIRDES